MKLIGAIFIIFGCGGCGFYMANSYLKELKMLNHFHSALEYMIRTLSYRKDPLPQLLMETAQASHKSLGELLRKFASLLEEQTFDNPRLAMHFLLSQEHAIPDSVKTLLLEFSSQLGSFDLDGQISSLQEVSQQCMLIAQTLTQDKDNRIRNYRTLGICAGVALAILFI